MSHHTQALLTRAYEEKIQLKLSDHTSIMIQTCKTNHIHKLTGITLYPLTTSSKMCNSNSSTI